MKEKSPIESPQAESAKKNSGYETDPVNLIALGATADDGRDYLFSYAQFLYAESSANPAQEDEPAAPPGRLHIHFATGDVVILGSGLHRLAAAVQKGSLKSVERISQNYAANLQVNVRSVTVTLNSPNP